MRKTVEDIDYSYWESEVCAKILNKEPASVINGNISGRLTAKVNLLGYTSKPSFYRLGFHDRKQFKNQQAFVLFNIE